MNSKPLKRDIWEWQFVDNPLVEKFDPVIISDKWDSVIGFNGVMPTRIAHKGEIIDAIWSCDFYVDGRFRGQKLGQKIKHRLHEYSNVVMALGISDMASHVLLRMGWKPNVEVDGFRRVNQIRNIRTLLLSGNQLFNSITQRLSPVKTGLEIEVTDKLPALAELNDLWNGVVGQYDNIIVRDYSYLSWRYTQHPLASYGFIVGRNANRLAGVLVFRNSDKSAVIVDYIGPARDQKLIHQLVSTFVNRHIEKEFLSCITSHAEIKRSLLASGFYKQRGDQRFYIYSKMEGLKNVVDNWFIMGGDSDGELLNAAREGSLKKSSEVIKFEKQSYSIKKLSESDFENIEDDWNNLVNKSSADPLFLGWVWQYNWWCQWGRKRNYELFILAVYDNDEKLVGLGPLYRVSRKVKGGGHIKQLQFVGSSWGARETVRSEFLDFICEKGKEITITNLLLDYLNSDRQWDQLVFADMPSNSLTRSLIEEGQYFARDYKRIVHRDMGTYINTSTGIENYRKRLGRHTRLKVFNRRNLLESKGTVQLDNADNTSIPEYFELLNEMHMVRWGKPCFNDESLNFQKHISQEYLKRDGLNLSSLKVSGEPLSILYNIKIGKTEYNIQSGYYDDYDSKLSLGSLHLGYAIEAAFSCPATCRFDLLAGAGKKSYYKSHYSSYSYSFVTTQINRSRYLRFIYSKYDSLPALIKGKLSKYFSIREIN